jgi:hypothetical protein
VEFIKTVFVLDIDTNQEKKSQAQCQGSDMDKRMDLVLPKIGKTELYKMGIGRSGILDRQVLLHFSIDTE